ncbi:hypothetical protein EDF81_0069 [Enterobacter sp. BIGb0383]|uniref:hypothetical protein n=1 Tax=unclassified Enterobacter TaxID=2608935 RepID=UPI000F460E0E|nr:MULTISPECIES: hypothetical protein [unclassified Enterobacter]ROP61598.1 hypothetical protein EDF81_0069 [Enterobacter sp. BIGb0383]ROS11759.1 hypothetical protein EC848_0069 [Enterobacter sp. BIGb0359]
MNIFKHYRNGTTHITSSGSTGYEPESRNETILAINIQHGEYHVHVYPDGIIISYKYIRIKYGQYFKIGKHKYLISDLERFTGSERKHLLYLNDLLHELLTEHSMGGVAVNDYRTVSVLDTHI